MGHSRSSMLRNVEDRNTPPLMLSSNTRMNMRHLDAEESGVISHTTNYVS